MRKIIFLLHARSVFLLSRILRIHLYYLGLVTAIALCNVVTSI